MSTYAETKMAECPTVLDAELKGSVIGDIAAKAVEWMKTIDVASIGKDALHMFLHFVMDQVKKWMDTAPESVDILLMALKALLEKVDETYWHTT